MFCCWDKVVGKELRISEVLCQYAIPKKDQDVKDCFAKDDGASKSASRQVCRRICCLRALSLRGTRRQLQDSTGLLGYLEMARSSTAGDNARTREKKKVEKKGMMASFAVETDFTKHKAFQQKSSKAINRYTTLWLSKKPSSILFLTYLAQHNLVA